MISGLHLDQDPYFLVTLCSPPVFFPGTPLNLSVSNTFRDGKYIMPNYSPLEQGRFDIQIGFSFILGLQSDFAFLQLQFT